MNNKSTENLIASEGSIEELFVPPLDLNNHKHSHSDTNSTVSEQPKQKNNEIQANPPIPAKRKSILPPIECKNGKDMKNDQNQITKIKSKHCDETVVRVINERKKCFEENEKDVSAGESEAGFRQISSKKSNNAIELTSLSKKTKNHIRKHFRGNEVNEETTSFVSYEEKHENEDNSKHLEATNSELIYTSDHINEDQPVEDFSTKQFETEQRNIKRDKSTKIKSKRKDSKKKHIKKKRENIEEKSIDEDNNDKEIKQNDQLDLDRSYDFKKIIGK